MDPSVSFATHSNLEDRWHKLLPEERAQADILLADASEIIRNRVRPYPETHDPAWWLAHERGLRCPVDRPASPNPRRRPARSPAPTRG